MINDVIFASFQDSTDSDEEMMRITEAAEEKQQQEKDDKIDGENVKPDPPKNEEEGSLEMRENFQKQFEEIMTSTL